jgi:hypothetical protein
MLLMCEKLDVIVDNEPSLPSSHSLYESIYQYIYHAYTYNHKEQLKKRCATLANYNKLT